MMVCHLAVRAFFQAAALLPVQTTGTFLLVIIGVTHFKCVGVALFVLLRFLDVF
jgi:hypothetical protein